MDDDWLLVFSLFVFEREFESVWLIEVTLDRRELPLTSDRVFEHEVELRSVERRFSWHRLIVESTRYRCVFEGFLGDLPDIVSSEIFLWSTHITNREGYPVAIHETKCRIKLFDDIDDRADFFLDLAYATEEVSIILSDRSDTSEA